MNSSALGAPGHMGLIILIGTLLATAALPSAATSLPVETAAAISQPARHDSALAKLTHRHADGHQCEVVHGPVDHKRRAAGPLPMLKPSAAEIDKLARLQKANDAMTRP